MGVGDVILIIFRHCLKKLMFEIQAISLEEDLFECSQLIIPFGCIVEAQNTQISNLKEYPHILFGNIIFQKIFN